MVHIELSSLSYDAIAKNAVLYKNTNESRMSGSTMGLPPVFEIAARNRQLVPLIHVKAFLIVCHSTQGRYASIAVLTYKCLVQTLQGS